VVAGVTSRDGESTVGGVGSVMNDQGLNVTGGYTGRGPRGDIL